MVAQDFLSILPKARAGAHIGIEVVLGAKPLNCWQVGEFTEPIGRVIGAVVATIEAAFHDGYLLSGVDFVSGNFAAGKTSNLVEPALGCGIPVGAGNGAAAGNAFQVQHHGLA